MRLALPQDYNAPNAFIRMLTEHNFGKQLIKVSA